MKTSKFRLSFLAWFGFGFAFPTICFSPIQEAHLRGSLTDPSGAGVAGAEVVEGVDPCGENGEFHSFAFDGPIFHAAIPIEVVPCVERDSFVFCDLQLRTDGGRRCATK